jgi:hypothetical protein
MGQAEGPDVDEGPPTAVPGTLQHTLQVTGGDCPGADHQPQQPITVLCRAAM